MEFIYEIPNVVSKELCEEMIERFSKDENKKPASTFDNIPNVRKSTNLWIGGTNTDWDDIKEKMSKIFMEVIVKYGHYLEDNKLMTRSGLVTNFSEIGIGDLYINLSKEDDYYNWHCDDTNKIRKKEARTFSCLVYLSTLEEDQGGCTEFMCGKKVRPEQGKVLIFPSCWTYEHRAAMVKNSGMKYTCGCWIT
jgi:hypothetical protein